VTPPSRGPRERVHTQSSVPTAPDDETYIVHRADTCFVVCNLFPYASGHLLVVPYREVADLEDLTSEETADLWATVTDASTSTWFRVGPATPTS
jgi:diadenosine tetraphosphate (Ap4A) HIT family hydrolase